MKYHCLIKLSLLQFIILRVFANGPGDQGSVLGCFIQRLKKMVPDTSLFNTQHYKVRIKGKVEQTGGKE